jgi:flagellar biosynthesis GTPase FlhF
MSEKSPSLMIKTILGHLQTGVDKLESGALSPEDMELLVEDAKELYERMVILRYKIYETNVLGVKEPVVSASIRQPEIETPIDLFGAIDEPTPEPEFEVTFANGEEDVEEEEEIVEAEEGQVHEEPQLNTETTYFELEKEEADDLEEDLPEQQANEALNEEELEEEILEEKQEPVHASHESVNEETALEEADGNWETHFSGDQPIWMAEMEANIRDSRSVFPLESLIGAFTLNEKLQFINELFDGSSDDFSTSIKQLDQLASMDAARNMLAELAVTFNWDTESEIVEDFIYKICRRHAAGA